MQPSPYLRAVSRTACCAALLVLLVLPASAADSGADRSGLVAQAPAVESSPSVAPSSGATPPVTPGAAPAAPPSAPARPASEGTPAVVVDGQQVESVLGKKVKSTGGDDMGRIVDIIADKSGQLRAAIVDFGGLLGVGSRQIAVDWKAIRFPLGEGKTDFVTVDLSRDQLRVAPVYKAGEQIVVLGKPAADAAVTPPAATATTPAAPPAAAPARSEAADPADPGKPAPGK